MTTKKELLDRDLPKWPAFAVTGKRVTVEQAMEIIIRTDSVFSYIGCNDHDWEKQIVKAMGLTRQDDYPGYDYNELEALREKMGCLSLCYLNNNRVMSSFVGGPHGWIDWSGNVFCNSYNIGKWPNIEEVYEDWSAIAKAFPYLELTSQLFDGEAGSEEETHPIVEFAVKNGKVKVREPKVAHVVTGCDLVGSMMGFFAPYRERGCTIQIFEMALKSVLGAR